MDYTVDIDESKLDMEDGILTNDVRGVIRPALKELKIAIMRRTSEFRQVYTRMKKSTRIVVHFVLLYHISYRAR